MCIRDSSPYFSLEDVCEILKIKDTKRAKTRLDEQGVCDAMTLTSSGFQKKDFISETNLYLSLIHISEPTRRAK
ncbi:MAG: BRO family protein, partial [Lactobacillus iners]|nr:BRO family protein [Lactobacillus iners]